MSLLPVLPFLRTNQLQRYLSNEFLLSKVLSQRQVSCPSELHSEGFYGQRRKSFTDF